MIKTLNPVAINEYQDLAKIDFLTGKEKSVIDLATFFKFLIDKKVLPQSEYARKIIKCSSSDAKNDILKITVNNETVYLDLFAALIEIDGYISTTEKSGNWSMRISTAQKSSDARCTKNATFTYRCCSGTSWTKEISSKDISSDSVYETVLGDIAKSKANSSDVVSIKTFNSLIDSINKVLAKLKDEDVTIKDTIYNYHYGDYDDSLPTFQSTLDLSDGEKVIDRTVEFCIDDADAVKWIKENNIQSLDCFIAPYLSNSDGKLDKVLKSYNEVIGTAQLHFSEEVNGNYWVALTYKVNKTEENQKMLVIIPRIKNAPFDSLLRWEEQTTLPCGELYFDHFWLVDDVVDFRNKYYHDETAFKADPYYQWCQYISEVVYTQLSETLKPLMTDEQYENYAKELNSIQYSFFKTHLDLVVKQTEFQSFAMELTAFIEKVRTEVNF